MESLEKYKAVLVLRKLLSSKYLPVVSAVVLLTCYYLGLDVIGFWYFGLCGFLIMLTCRDVSPIFSVFLMMGLIISAQNTPSILWGEPSDYYTRPENLVMIALAVSLMIVMAIVRTVGSIKRGTFKANPVFIGLCAFVVAMLLNGVFSQYHTIMGTVYALFLALVFPGIFCFACGTFQVNGRTFERIAFSFLVLLAVLTIELVVAYLTYGNLFEDGSIVRGNIRFGWGTYNNFGMYATLCIPASFYLAAKYKDGWAFLFAAILNMIVAFLSMSRQAILMDGILFVACAIWLLIRTKGRARLYNALVIFSFAFVGLVAMAAMYKQFAHVFSSLAASLETGSSRTDIWKQGLEVFLNYPLFGGGFFSRKQWIWGESGFANVIPVMYHNTVIQLLASGGLIGFGTYAVHRIQTVLSFFKNVTHDRVFIALTISGLLLVSLLDNHIFYLFPTIIYSMLLGVLVLSEKKVEIKGEYIKGKNDLTIAA